MKQFCSQHGLNRKYQKKVLQHLLFDDDHKVMYCYVPKAGCTMMKTAFLMLQKLFTMDELEKSINVTHKEYLSKVRSLCYHFPTDNRTLSCNVPINLIKYKLKTYYKFMIVRNPMERLYSAFHEKLTTSTSPHMYQLMQQYILQYSDDRTSKFPNFKQFVNAFLDANILINDEHFLSMVEICDPCSIRYDFYVNFANMNHDISQMFQLLEIPQEYYFNKIRHAPVLMPHHSVNNTVLVKEYNQLQPDMVNQLYKRYSTEMEVFRMLYPEQMNKLDQRFRR